MENPLETRLKSINLKYDMIFGAPRQCSVFQMIGLMSDTQVKKMFEDNLDVKYLFLDLDMTVYKDYLERSK